MRKLLAQPFNLGYDNFLGRLAVVRIYEGKIKAGQNLIFKKSRQSPANKQTSLPANRQFFELPLRFRTKDNIVTKNIRRIFSAGTQNRHGAAAWNLNLNG